MILKKIISLLLVTSFIIPILPMNIFASSKWVATPYHDENGNIIDGLEGVTKGKLDWTSTTESMPAEVVFNGSTLTMSNGSIVREFNIPEVGDTDFYTKSYKNTYIEKELLSGEVAPDTYLGLYDKPYREIYSGENILIEPDYYFIGGNAEENAKWIENVEPRSVVTPSALVVEKLETTTSAAVKAAPELIPTNTFVFDGYEIFDTCEKPFEWEPRSKPYSDPAAFDWPPKGKRVEFTFSAPDSFPAAYKGVKVKLIYEIYDNLAAMKKRVVLTQENDNTITIGRLAPEVLKGNENMEKLFYIEISYTGGHDGTIPFDSGLSCKCSSESINSSFKELENIRHTCYDIGPAYELPDNLGKNTFSSFEIYELVHSTYWFEQQSRERLGMYRKLFPWITDSPLTFHNTGALTKDTIDMVAESGFEMIIQSYGSPAVGETKSMLTRNTYTLNKYRDLVNYARNKGIDIGIYQAQYQLNAYKKDPTYGKNNIGNWGTWCLASAAFDDYWDNFKYFLEYTGVNCVEIDGTYPNCLCDNGESHVNADRETDPSDSSSSTTGNPSKYAIHNGYFDSKVKQWENVLRMMNTEFRGSGIYIKVPAWYYVNGGNKCGIGYEEIAWSQPRKEQLLYARQLMYNASFVRTMSMSWSHIPFKTYHGGGSDAAFYPFAKNKEDYNWVLAQNMGNGVTSDYRGTTLYDNETKDIIKKWVDMFKKYRGIVNADFVHISQASYGKDTATVDRSKAVAMDTLFHADTNNEGEKGLLWVYNQTDEERTETITVPMYYTGLTDLEYPPASAPGSTGKDVHGYGEWPPNYSWLPEYKDDYVLPEATGRSSGKAIFLAEGVSGVPKEIDSNGNVKLEVTLPPMSFTYYTIYDESEAPNISISVGKVQGLKAGNVTDNSISIEWDKDVAIDVKEDEAAINDHELSVDHYQIYRNGKKYETSIENTFTDVELKQKEIYDYSVAAVVSGVEGEQSKTLSIVTQLDDVPPKLVSTTPISTSQIRIIFNEAVNSEAELIVNYNVNSGSDVIFVEQKSPKEVLLTVKKLKPEIDYTLTVSNISDMSGNTLEESSMIFNYGYIRKFNCDTLDENVLVDLASKQNGTTSNVSNGESIYNKALAFDAEKESFGDLGPNILKEKRNYSISMWVKPSVLNNQVILSQGQDGHSEEDFTISMEDGYVVFRTSNEDDSQNIKLKSKEKLLQDWSQLVLVRKDNEFSMYQNGDLVASDINENIGTNNNLNSMIIGAQKNHAGGEKTNFYTGLIDEIVFYAYPRNKENVLMDYYKNPKAFEGLLNQGKAFEEKIYTPESYSQLANSVNNLESIKELVNKEIYENELYIAVMQLKSAIENLEIVDKYKNIYAIYSLEDTNGTTVEDSVTGKLGTIVNGNRTSTGTPFGKGVLFSDYIGNYIKIDTDDLIERDKYTIQGYIKPWAKNTENMMPADKFINEYEAAGEQFIFASGNDLKLTLKDGYLNLTVDDGTSPLKLTSSTEIKYDVINLEKRQSWNNFAVVRNEDEFILYLNGKEVAKGNKSASKNKKTEEVSDTMHLGSDTNGKNNFNGILDEFIIYTDALLKQEIQKKVLDNTFVKAERTNIAKDAKVSAKPNADDPHRLTDGKLYVMAGKETPFTARSKGRVDSQTFDIDLGGEYSIDALSYTYFSRAYGSQSSEQNKFRTYIDVVIQTSDSADFTSGVETVYNTDADNSLGYGVGTDIINYSTDLGYDIVLDSPVIGRYVRIISGNFYNFKNVIEKYVNVNELEVFGLNLEDLKTKLSEFITQGESVDLENYTDSSVANVKSALESGKSTLNNSGATLEDIQNQINSIKEAIESLKPIKITEPKLINSYPFGTGVSVVENTVAVMFNKPVTPVAGKEMSIEVDGVIYKADVSQMKVENVGVGSVATVNIDTFTGQSPLVLDYEKNYILKLEERAFEDLTGSLTTAYNGAFSTSKNTEKYTVSIIANTGGRIIQGASGEYNSSDTIKLLAEPDENYKFSNWELKGKGILTDNALLESSFIVLEGDAEIMANFQYVEPAKIPVENISLNKTNCEIKVSDVVQLIPTITPKDATNKNVFWTSHNEEIAEVNNTGIVVGKKAGTTTIVATTEDGNKQVTCEIIVIEGEKEVAVSGVELNKSELELKVDETYDLVATVLPVNADNKNITWTSSDENVAAVYKGKVFAKVEGKVEIEVRTVDGGYVDVCKVEVKAKDTDTGTDDGNSNGGNYPIKGSRGYSKKITNEDEIFVSESEIPLSYPTKFDDVNDSDWYAKSVKFVAERGYMFGMGNNLFKPNENMSRAMVVTVLWRMAGSPIASEDAKFTDIPKDTWYTNAVNWAYENKIISGYGNGLFAPNSPLTREQIAVIFRNFANENGIDVSGSSDVSGFEDALETSKWALDGVAWANEVGLLYGRNETLLVPKGNVTRAEVSAILERYVSIYESNIKKQ
ncbi:MAG: S-layer homology domain-containing protein [Lachnospirales bacterium]